MRSERPLPIGVLVFTGAYMLAALAGAIGTGNKEFLFYIGMMVVLIAGVYVVYRRVPLHPVSLWLLTSWGALHMAGGLVPLPDGWPYNGPHAVLYSLWLIPERLKYDQVVHAFGFGTCVWIVWQGLQAATGVERPTFGLLFLCGLAGMGLGALNEVIEFVATLTVPETNVGGYRNTGWDLVANMVGVIIAMGWIGLAYRGKPMPSPPE